MVNCKTNNLLFRLLQKIGQDNKKRLLFTILFSLFVACAEVFGISAVLPFVGVIIAPEAVFSQYAILGKVAQQFNVTSATEMVVLTTVIFVFASLISGGSRLLFLWNSSCTTAKIGIQLSMQAYIKTLYQPYLVHLNRNSSEAISVITNKIDFVVFVVLQSTIALVSYSIVLLAVVSVLFAINPVISLITMLCFGGSYLLISLIFRRKLRNNGKKIAENQTMIVKVLQEGLGGIRDVLLDGNQQFYCDIYHKANQPLHLAKGYNLFLSSSPRFIMEALGMSVIAVLAYKLCSSSGGSGSVPILAALALSSQRMLPVLQQIFSSWANIISGNALLSDILKSLDQELPRNEIKSSLPLPFNKNLVLDNVSFYYQKTDKLVLDKINLCIAAGTCVGIVGRTGSGKSTLLDVIMGLLIPSAGKLMVDDQIVDGTLINAWQKNIAHVPQNIYLSDASIVENIAFGVSCSAIDFEKVCVVAEQAQLTDFINDLTDGYNTKIGERGVRLSGGQRQRIGIARALYKGANVLVLDEATSALDNVTEKLVRDSINKLCHNITVFIVAHRLTTIKECDIVLEVEKGRIVSQGTYDELLQRSYNFQKMMQALHQ